MPTLFYKSLDKNAVGILDGIFSARSGKSRPTHENNISTYVVPVVSDDDGRAGWPLINTLCLANSAFSAERLISRSFGLSFCWRIASSKSPSSLSLRCSSTRVILTEFSGCGGTFTGMECQNFSLLRTARKGHKLIWLKTIDAKALSRYLYP